MKFYEHWKLFAPDIVKESTELEIWRMKNDQAYREKSRDEISEIFNQCDVDGNGLLNHTETVYFVQRTNTRLVFKDLWPDDGYYRAENLLELCNAINPRTEGCTFDEILAPMQLKADIFIELKEEDEKGEVV